MCSSDKKSESDNSKLSKNAKERRWDKAKKILKKNLKIRKDWILLFVFLLSVGTFYYQFIHNKHDFKCLVLDYMAASDGTRSSQVVLINDGTYTETLCNAKLVYSNKKDFGEKDLVCVLGKSKQGAISLKPGDRKICLVEDKSESWMLPLRVDGWIKNMSKEEAISWLEKREKLPYRIHCGVLFEVIGESGKMHKTWIYVGSTSFYKEYGFVWPLSEKNVIVNLLKPNYKKGGSVRSDSR